MNVNVYAFKVGQPRMPTLRPTPGKGAAVGLGILRRKASGKPKGVYPPAKGRV